MHMLDSGREQCCGKYILSVHDVMGLNFAYYEQDLRAHLFRDKLFITSFGTSDAVR